ncbi:MAG: hypothetical protein PUF72_09675 [Clostridiales bacterium]|nr:hypothetical protein [Clostridiales bacterium]
MKKYEEPGIKITKFSAERVVTVSGINTNLGEAENNIGTSNYKKSSYSELFK